MAQNLAKRAQDGSARLCFDLALPLDQSAFVDSAKLIQRDFALDARES